MINNEGLHIDPWYNQGETRKSYLRVPLTQTGLWTFLYIDCTVSTNHVSMPSFLKTYYALSKAFCKCTNPKCKFFLFANYSSCKFLNKKKKKKKKSGLKLSGLWSQVVMQFSTFAAQGSLCILKIVNHFQTSGYNFYFKDEVVFLLFYNAPCVVASFDLLNILNITWNTNIVMYKQIYLLLCLIVSWHASF